MWKIIECAVQGRGHIKEDIPCQDKTFSLINDGINVIALADGAGSAKLSHIGAQRVTQFICSDLSDNFEDYFSSCDGVLVKKELMSKIMVEIDSLSREHNCEIKDLASTLMFVAVKGDCFIIFHIGDGVVGYLKNNELKIASLPENGEFTNTTIFTTSSDALMTLKLIKGRLKDISGFVLMSDGTETSLYNKNKKTLADALKRIMNLCTVVPSEKIEEKLQSSFENVIKYATMDDCSIAIMVKENPDFKGYLYLDNFEKARLLKLKYANSTGKRLRKFDEILDYLRNEHTLKEISRVVFLKPKFARKTLNVLLNANLVEKRNSKYHTIVIMD